MSGHISFPIFQTYVRSSHSPICWSCLRQVRVGRTKLQPLTTSLTSALHKSSISSSSSSSSFSHSTQSTTSDLFASKGSTPAPPPTSAKKPTTEPKESSKSAKLTIPKKPSDDFVPPVLQHALGLPERPQPGQNSGIDTRTWRQRRDDFHNYEKHLQRRKQL